MVEVKSITQEAVTVDVSGREHVYPARHAALEKHLNTGGTVENLWGLLHEPTAEGERWVWLDETPIAYLIEIRPTVRKRLNPYRILAAAMCPWEDKS